MKELSIEEKAKRYDEAIKIAKDSFTYPDYPGFIRANIVFPELIESEDERIRKALRERIIRYDPNNEILIKEEGISQKQFLAWLEKQDEQKPVEWSEEDEQNYDTLLKIICSSNKSESLVNELFNWFKSLKYRVSPKQDWSEEDNKMLLQIINEFESIKFYSSTVFEKNIMQDKIDWLKSFKDKVFPQPKQDWSEEQQQTIKDAASFILSCINTVETKEEEKRLEELADKLQDLRPQNNITDEELTQAKKDAYNNALDKIEYYSDEPTFGDGWDAAIWYLKKRNIINTWKPSDRQLEVMSYLAKYYAVGIDEPNRSIIISLYEDLQKLRKK